MARPREFERTQAVERATEVFWEHGYEGASLSRLLVSMGISKSSFYDTFGSKHRLYLETIAHYTDTYATGRATRLIGSHANPIAGIRAFFDAVIDELVMGVPTGGCFLTSCCSHGATQIDEAGQLIGSGLSKVEDIIEAALRDAMGHGQLATPKDPKDLARFLNASLQGIIIVGKARRDAAALRSISTNALSSLE